MPAYLKAVPFKDLNTNESFSNGSMGLKKTDSTHAVSYSGVTLELNPDEIVFPHYASIARCLIKPGDVIFAGGKFGRVEKISDNIGYVDVKYVPFLQSNGRVSKAKEAWVSLTRVERAEEYIESELQKAEKRIASLHLLQGKIAEMK